MEVGLIKQFERYGRKNNIPEVYQLLTDPGLADLTHADLKMGSAVRLSVAGDRGIYLILQEVTTLPEEEGLFEAHRDHLDIHVPLKGAESIGYTPLDSRVSPGGPQPVYDRSVGDDITYAPLGSPGEMTVIRLVEGMYAVFEPDDVHMPRLQTDGPSYLKKIVLKVPMDLVAPPDEELLAAAAEQGSSLDVLLDL